MKHVPLTRLSSAKVGQTVSLATGKKLHKELYVGSVSDGYACLWRNKEDKDSGKDWQTMACLSHEIEVMH